MMMHSCIKNTRLTFTDDNVLTILARIKVRDVSLHLSRRHAASQDHG
jgi:hypothetical protein